MFSVVDRLARRLVRQGIRRGLIEGSMLWLVVGAAAGLVRLMSRPDEPKISTESLRLGESVVVTHAVSDYKKRSARRSQDADQ